MKTIDKIILLFYFIFCNYNSFAVNVSKYNVIWNSPSKDASGVMPIGNGDIGAGVYAIENGDLYLLLSKNDAYNYCGDLFKTGRIKISFSPNPLKEYKEYVQTLDVATGSLKIKSDDTDITVWVDANNPVCHVNVNSIRPVEVSVEHDLWKRFDYCVFNTINNKGEVSGKVDYGEATQDSIININDGLMWLFNVGNKSVYENDLKYYDVEYLSEKYEDPYKYNIFGNYVKSDNMQLEKGRLTGKSKNFDIRIYSFTKKTKKSGRVD